MRIAILTLAVFCALISGWTAALAQVQDLGGAAVMHHAGMAAGHAMAAEVGQDNHPPCTAAQPCNDHPKAVHPLLCAACFAVVLDAHGLDRIALPAGTIHPVPQKPMQATALKPRFPPPKASLSFS